MSTPKTLVFIGAHPDDETFGVGGTLAHYASSGVRVYYICATRGEAGLASPESMQGYTTIGDMRWAELKCAARILGLTDIIHLGYRDSGMAGSENNNHPEALVTAPPDQVTGRLVKIIRDLKPEVIITFDPIGGYRHPDHVAIHKATVAAFHATGDSQQYPKAGTPYQPQKLYFHVFSRRFLRIAVKLLPLFGQDPHHFGKNKDIDITNLTEVRFPVHASVKITKQFVDISNRAAACYASQIGGGPPHNGLLSFAIKLAGRRDLFMRAYPPANSQHEGDLFEGVR